MPVGHLQRMITIDYLKTDKGEASSIYSAFPVCFEPAGNQMVDKQSIFFKKQKTKNSALINKKEKQKKTIHILQFSMTSWTSQMQISQITKYSLHLTKEHIRPAKGSNLGLSRTLDPTANFQKIQRMNDLEDTRTFNLMDRLHCAAWQVYTLEQSYRETQEVVTVNIKTVSVLELRVQQGDLKGASLEEEFYFLN